MSGVLSADVDEELVDSGRVVDVGDELSDPRQEHVQRDAGAVFLHGRHCAAAVFHRQDDQWEQRLPCTASVTHRLQDVAR